MVNAPVSRTGLKRQPSSRHSVAGFHSLSVWESTEGRFPHQNETLEKPESHSRAPQGAQPSGSHKHLVQLQRLPPRAINSE